jgi:hypothetical protein
MKRHRIFRLRELATDARSASGSAGTAVSMRSGSVVVNVRSGQNRKCRRLHGMSVLAPRTDVVWTPRDVRKVPIAVLGTTHLGWYSLRRATR